MLVDSHCHLDFPDFDAERTLIIDRAHSQGVEHMLTISTRLRQADRVKQIADAHEHVTCSIGTHPHNAADEDGVLADEIVALCDHPKVVAVGEAGLDYHYDNAPRDAQARGLRQHIIAARETGLPLVIHARSADDDMASMLEEAHHKDGSFPMVLHCFSSGADLAKRGLALGAYISFAGILTFKRADALRAIAREVPDNRILVETDAPYLAPVPYRGKRNEPSFVTHTAEMLATVRDEPVERIADLTTDNFFRLFSKARRP